MYIEEALYDYLQDQTGLTNLISDRLYYNKAPADPTKPYVVFFKTEGIRYFSHDGSSELAHPRIQFSVYSTTYDDAKDVAEQLRIALHGTSGTLGDAPGVKVGSCFLKDEIDSYDEDLELHHVALDFSVMHEE